MVLRFQSLVVKPMSRLVQHAIKRLGEIAFVVARCQARITWPQARAKRMRCGVDAARIEIKAEGARHLAIENLLAGRGVVAFQ